MDIDLTPDEAREVSLAIAAYRQALDHFRDNHTISDSIRYLDSARAKLTKEWEKSAVLTRTHRPPE